MNDEEAIERMKDITNYINENSKYKTYGGYYIRCRSKEAKMFETILNLIEKQKAEIEEKDKSLKLHTKLEYQYKNDYLNVIEDLKKKDKQIDLMANNLIGVVFSDNDNKEILFDNKEDVKQYYENKVEEDK